MSAAYGKYSMSCSCVLEWHKRFCEGSVSLQDDAQHPPYSPDISPSDVPFLELKKNICGCCFALGKDVCDWVKNWFGRQPTSFLKMGFIVLPRNGINVIDYF